MPEDVRSALAGLPGSGADGDAPATSEEEKPKLQSRNSVVRLEDGSFSVQGEVPAAVRARLSEVHLEQGGPTNVQRVCGVRALPGGGFESSTDLPEAMRLALQQMQKGSFALSLSAGVVELAHSAFCECLDGEGKAGREGGLGGGMLTSAAALGQFLVRLNASRSTHWCEQQLQQATLARFLTHAEERRKLGSRAEHKGAAPEPGLTLAQALACAFGAVGKRVAETHARFALARPRSSVVEPGAAAAAAAAAGSGFGAQEGEGGGEGVGLGRKGFLRFLRTEQGMRGRSEEELEAIWRAAPRSGADVMDAAAFQCWLLSAVNDALDPKESGVHEDMTRPLTDYLINSSHNSYLDGRAHATSNRPLRHGLDVILAVANVLRRRCREWARCGAGSRLGGGSAADALPPLPY